MMDNKQVEKISKALGDASRIHILQNFKNGGNCLYCSQINEMLDLSQPSVSHHLKQLVDSGLLLPKKEGREVWYSLNRKILREYTDYLTLLMD